jgi:hypothetical protein
MNGLFESIGGTLTLTRLPGFGLPTRVQAMLLSKMPGRTDRGHRQTAGIWLVRKSSPHPQLHEHHHEN